MRKAATYDVVILGSGSTAAAAAEVARDLNKKILVTEERLIGGTCLNYGCVPSKFLIEAAKAYFTMRRPRFFGLQCLKSKLSFENLIQQKDDIIREYRERKRDTIFDDDQISLVKGHARFIDEHTIDVAGKRFSGEKIFVATGSRPKIPDIDGLAHSGFLTSDLLTCDESVELTTLPESLIIIGGGYIAIELGQMFTRFGTKVTMIERSSHLLSHGYEPEVGEVIQRVFEEEGIEFLFNASVRSVNREGKNGLKVVVKIGRKVVELKAEQILIATGRQANADNICAEQAGIKLAKDGHVKVDRHFRTSTKHIYAAGDVIGNAYGNQMATPVGVRDARMAIQNAFCDVGGKLAEHKIIPRAIFSDPEVATVGITAEQAREKQHKFETRTLPLSRVPRSVLMQHSDGVVKIVSDRVSQEILGVTVVGPCAGEVIQQAAMGMRLNARLSDFSELIYVYPSIAEGLRFAARLSAD